LLLPAAAEDGVRDRVEDLRREVPEDSHPREDDHDRERLACEPARRRIEAGQRGRDDRPVQRPVPGLVENAHEAERAADEDDDDRDGEDRDLAARERTVLHGPLVSKAAMDESPPERQLNIHMDPQHLAGVYANFANITFSDYEFTLTFARIDHEVEEGDVPG